MISKIIVEARAELTAGMALTKCQQCGCMREALDNLAATLQLTQAREAQALGPKVAVWQTQMRAIRYACLGCDHLLIKRLAKAA